MAVNNVAIEGGILEYFVGRLAFQFLKDFLGLSFGCRRHDDRNILMPGAIINQCSNALRPFEYQ